MPPEGSGIAPEAIQRDLGKDTTVLRNPWLQEPLSGRERWEVCADSLVIEGAEPLKEDDDGG